MQAQILAPAAVLVAWTLVMMFWMAGTRFPAMKKVRGDLSGSSTGKRGQDLEGVIPDKVNWKSHNYAHLHEQPTIFYAAVLIIAVVGGSSWEALLAWIYVGLRIAHSIYQATVNKVMVRFSIFGLASLALVVLAVRAVMLTLFADPSTFG